MKLLELTPAELAELPVDELAMLALRDAHERQEWHWHNAIRIVQAELGIRAADPAIAAVTEAWQWLLTHNLVAWDLTQSSAEAIRITRLGHQVLERGLVHARAVQRLNMDLVPELEDAARPQFLRGDFELAVFAAMREVEIAVRAAADMPDDLVGKDLMNQAFRENGPLWSDDLNRGESTAQMNLFAGAVGLFKNPASHRRVDHTDPTQAAEIILLADLLLRLLRTITVT